jgi:2-desacetyl-2-hydroxyethyl bacteriochlorophyllide A dehydrogenase
MNQAKKAERKIGLLTKSYRLCTASWFIGFQCGSPMPPLSSSPGTRVAQGKNACYHIAEMKAVEILEPLSAAIRSVDTPALGPEDVRIAVRRLGYCGSDLNTFRGKNPLVHYPIIPGHELAGEVVEVGAEVPETIAVGRRVTASPYSACGRCTACRSGRVNACRDNQTLGVQRNGALTEEIVLPWRKLYSSDSLSFAELALVEPLTVGFHASDRGGARKGKRCLVFGCGTIGLGAIAGAAWRGAEVIAVDVVARKLETARKAGAAHTIDTSTTDLHEALAELTDGEGPEIAIEAIGLPQTYRAAVEEVAYTGTVVYIGYAKDEVCYDSSLFVKKELDIRGSRNALEDFGDVIRLLETGDFPVDEVITHTVAFDQADEILRRWNADPGEFTKIQVEIG